MSPGGNVTGLTLMQTELSRKRLQLLREAAPGASLVAVIWNPTDPSAAEFLRETEAAARSLALKLHAIEARAPADLDAAFKAVADLRPSAFFTLPGSMFQANVRRIIDFAVKRRLPGVFPNRAFVEAGGLLSYAPNLAASWRRAADKILKGAKPADLPIEQPTQFELVVNMRTAKPSASRSRPRCWRGRTKSSSDGRANIRRVLGFCLAPLTTEPPGDRNLPRVVSRRAAVALESRLTALRDLTGGT